MKTIWNIYGKTIWNIFGKTIWNIYRKKYIYGKREAKHKIINPRRSQNYTPQRNKYYS